MSLMGKVAVVTGSSRGIGRAIAQRLAAAGATVVVTARSVDSPTEQRRFTGEAVPGTLAETISLIEAAGGKAIPLAADIDNPEQLASLIDRAVEAAGRIDILVNNAGYALYSPVADMPLDMFDSTVSHYLRVPFVLSQAAIPHFRRQGAGWIVNIGSCTSLPPERPFPDYARSGVDTVYASVKAAINRFTQGLAAELENDNIAVNLVAPSTAIRTEGATELIPEEYPGEDVAYLAETVLAMSHLPASERTGLLAYSMHYPWATDLQVYTLDGREELPATPPPAWAPAGISATGE